MTVLDKIYCLQRQSDGNYLPLNRAYAPIGCDGSKVYQYNELPGVRLNMTPEIAARLSYAGDPDERRIYLYIDSCGPWQNDETAAAYAQRLELLESIKANS